MSPEGTIVPGELKFQIQKFKKFRKSRDLIILISESYLMQILMTQFKSRNSNFFDSTGIKFESDHTRHVTGAYTDNCNFSSADTLQTRTLVQFHSTDTSQTQTTAFSKNADTLQTQTALIHKIADMSQTLTDCRQACPFNSACNITSLDNTLLFFLFNFIPRNYFCSS